MKLLFDQNISFRLLKQISQAFPEANQVKELGLENSSDSEIWEFARDSNFDIVTFDSDFYDLSVIRGIPPKIIWLRIGNTSTINIAKVLIENQDFKPLNINT
jgi:predicted nuclease of predicted toxin-antitoxin system